MQHHFTSSQRASSILLSPSAWGFFLLGLLFTLESCQTNKSPSFSLTEQPSKVSLFAEGVISTAMVERDIAISPDGKRLIYTLGNYKQTRRCLVEVQQHKGKWQAGEVLTFSGRYQDIEPFFSPDGKRLYFASNRPIYGQLQRKDYNIWVCELGAEGWTEPVALDSIINSPQDEFYPAVSQAGHLYFTATRANGVGREDIFRSAYQDGQYQIPVALDSNINSKVYEFNAYISPSEDLLIFSAYGRPDGLGGSDLYYSKKDEQGRWQAAQHFGPEINSNKLDYCPFIDYPRGNFYFTSERYSPSTEELPSVKALRDHAQQAVNGMGNIYRIGLKHLGIE